MRRIARAGLALLPAPIAVRAHYFAHHKRLPNLRRPERFSEKVIRRKLFDRDPRLPQRADKIAVKDFVARTLGDAWVTPTLWSGPSLPPRPERNWPTPFVLKANNGSGTNAFVRSETERDWDALEQRCHAWLSTSHANWAGEWLYAQIEPQLLVEPFLGSLAALPLDYKLFVFAGRVEFIEVDTDRAVDHKRTLFDRDWSRQPFALGYKLEGRDIPRPRSLDAMIDAAERLAEDLPFVRIDFYEVDAVPIFGEMTFYPDAGMARFEPDAYDKVFGGLWK
ncbi:MAG TPA: ATP-grasp fold amidoligase family protein [Roseiarcus sp.]|nr:ATP-grasp fold amidoligase family protein [Roseiarcus sp.]